MSQDHWHRFGLGGRRYHCSVALFTGVFVYPTIKWKDCAGAFRRAFRNSAMVFIIIAASGPFSWLLTSLGAISDLESWLMGLAGSPFLFILAIMLFIFFAWDGNGFCGQYHHCWSGFG